MVNDEILYTFNSKCQKFSKHHASFFILKVKGKASYNPPNSFDTGSDSTFNKIQHDVEIK